MSFTLYIGCMFSNKTSRMFIDYSQKSYNLKGIAFKPKMDNRYSDTKIVGHNKKIVINNVISTDNPKDILEKSEEYNVVAIDELQFFDKSIRDVIEKLVISGKDVISSALSGDYRREQWETVSHCIPICDDIIHLKGICTHCKKNASCTHMKGYKINKNAKPVIVSSNDLFIPLCTKCYYLSIK